MKESLRVFKLWISLNLKRFGAPGNETHKILKQRAVTQDFWPFKKSLLAKKFILCFNEDFASWPAKITNWELLNNTSSKVILVGSLLYV